VTTTQLDLLVNAFGLSKVDFIIDRVQNLPVEVPSWGFGRGGTRFETFKSGLEPSTPKDRLESAGVFHHLTGKGKTVALHFPWDGSSTSDVKSLKPVLKKNGIEAGTINSNLFSMRGKGRLDANLRFGSLTNSDLEVRIASVKHNLDCLEYARILGSKTLVLWLPDGTNSPGQMSMYDQADRLEDCLSEIYSHLADDETLLIEYKNFEPGFYSMAIQDYARSAHLCSLLGDKAKVLVDLGHHAHGTNIEQIIAHLLRQNKLGAFHFNDRFNADDDLAAGSLHPHQLFRIFANLVEGELRGYTPVDSLALMIDQSHNIKNPLEEMIESVGNIEIAYAKALLIDFNELKKARDACDPTKADQILHDAFLSDVRPILNEARRRKNLPENAIDAYRKSR
jgi:L-rhamnose isomerase / sugar isomerase